MSERKSRAVWTRYPPRPRSETPAPGLRSLLVGDGLGVGDAHPLTVLLLPKAGAVKVAFERLRAAHLVYRGD